MKITLLSLIASILIFSNYLNADPLTDEQIASFSINNLTAESFDKRMETFRIIEQKKWQERYKKEAIKAIKKQLSSSDVMLNRTGIQGQNGLMYSNEEIDTLIIKLANDYNYRKGSQPFYFQQSLIEYMSKKMLMGKKNKECNDKKASAHGYEIDWDVFVQAVVDRDLQGVGSFASSDSIDSEHLINVLNHPAVLNILRKTNYADLTPIKNNNIDDKTLYEFSADSNKDKKIIDSVKLYFAQEDKLVLSHYIVLN